MENASKALIIAASVILGVLLLTVMIFVFRAGGRAALSYDASIDSNQLALYNSHFEQFIGQYNTVSDIISVCNLAYDSNFGSDYDASWKVNIKIKYGSNVIFEVPNVQTNGYDRNKILIKTTGYKTDKIQTYGSGVASIYCLTQNTLGDLGIITGSTDYLTDSKIGSRDIYDEYNQVTHTDTNVTIYKYYFNCLATDCTYNGITGRVDSMTFELYKNSDY